MKPKTLADLYSYRVSWSEDDDTFVARVVEWPGLTAHGETIEEAMSELLSVVLTTIHDCAEHGSAYPSPLSTRRFSGKFNLRIPPSLHRQIEIRAAEEGVSLNQWITMVLSELFQ